LKKLTFITLLTILTLLTAAFNDCDEAQAPAVSSADFRIANRLEITDLGKQVLVPYQVLLSGVHLQDSSDFALPHPSGGNYSFPPIMTGTDGRYTCSNGRAPALWRFTLSSGFCAGQSVLKLVEHGKDKYIDCIKVGGVIASGFAAVPSTIDIDNPPGIVTIYGDDMNIGSGMPTIEYYDQYGNLSQQAQATACATDGSWISGPTPDLASCLSGEYTLIVRNVEGDSVGSAVIDVFSTPPPDCNPTQQELTTCGELLGWWDSISCQCNYGPQS
jgi:hypothetical protein